MTYDSNTLDSAKLDDVKFTSPGKSPGTYMLPKKMFPSKQFFENVGFTFEDVGDNIFYQTVLPQGWSIDDSFSDFLSVFIDINGNKCGAYYRNQSCMFLYYKNFTLISLPQKMFPSKNLFESLGFTFKDVGSKTLYQTTLPEGWSIDYSSNNSLTFLIDKKGRKRVTIYSINNSSHYMCLLRRFSIKSRPLESNNLNSPILIYIEDTNGCVITSIGSADRGSSKQDYLINQAKAFLNSNYPDWENPCKYWD